MRSDPRYRELDAELEHQQDDADVGQRRDVADVADRPGRVRADENPAEQIAEEGGLAEALSNHTSDERRADRQDEIAEKGELRHQVPEPSPELPFGGIGVRQNSQGTVSRTWLRPTICVR